MKASILVVLVSSLLGYAGTVTSRGAEPSAQEKLIVLQWSVVLLGNGATESLPAFATPPSEAAGGVHGPLGSSFIVIRGVDGQELDVAAGEEKPIALWPAGPAGTAAGPVQWRGTLAKTPKVEPRPVTQGHGWSRLRESGLGMYFNVAAGASESFLFYRAPVRAEPAVRAHVTSDAITLTNAGDNPSGPVVVVLNDGLSRNGARVGSVPPKEEVTLSRAGMTEVSWDDRETLGAVESAWRAAGLSQAEARAAVGAWREELLHRPGFLLISRLPSDEYEKCFPLSVKPEPMERLRVGMVFDTLADQKERASWLVNLDQSVAQWVKHYAGGDATQRSAAVRNFEAAGELTEPFLRDLAKGSDPAVAKAAGELLKRQ